MTNNNQPLKFTPGDVIIERKTNGWSCAKILEVDIWPDGSENLHCSLYREFSKRPILENLTHADVFISHAPFAAEAFADWERIGNQPLTEMDLAGFISYLKMTDFQRYISYSGQDVEALVKKANEHYQKANRLCEEGLRLEGIERPLRPFLYSSKPLTIEVSLTWN